jgi:hypothetical protein
MVLVAWAPTLPAMAQEAVKDDPGTGVCVYNKASFSLTVRNTAEDSPRPWPRIWAGERRCRKDFAGGRLRITLKHGRPALTAVVEAPPDTELVVGNQRVEVRGADGRMIAAATLNRE